MSVRVVCPECGATTVNENPARTAVHCQQCGKEVEVPGAPVAALPPMPKRSATVTAPADDPGFELIDEEEVKTDTRPSVGRAAADDDGDWVAGAPRRPVVGARDEDDAPHRRASRRRDEDDDDDDDDRRPRSRARRDDDDDDDGASKKAGDDDFEVVRDADDEDEDPLQRRAARLARLAEEGESARGRDRDDDDDRPRRRPPSKSKAPLLVLALLAFLLLGAGGGAAAYFLWPKDDDSTPIVRNDDPEPEDVPPGDPGVIDPKKDDTKSKDTKSKDTKTTDAQTKEKQPVDTKQKDKQPVDTKGNETKPKDDKQPVDTKGKETKPKDDKQPTVASKPKLVQPVAGRLPITPADMTAPHVEVELPCQAREACVGGGGRYLIFHCPAKRKLVVFDTSTLKVVKTMTLGADEALIAAGMSKILVVYPTEKQVVRYDLATFAPDLDAPLLTAQKPTDVAMGSATVGPLVVGGIPSQGNASKMSLMFLDVETLNEVPIDRAEGDFKVTFGAAAHLRISADGRMVAAWYQQLQPSGIQIARLNENTITGSYRAESVGYVAPGPDGETLFTQAGMFNTKAEPVQRRETVVPAVHGNWYLTVASTGENRPIAVWEPGRDAPIAGFDNVPGLDGKRDPFERDNPNLALDKRLFLVPDARVLVVLPPAADKVHVYKIEPPKGK